MNIKFLFSLFICSSLLLGCSNGIKSIPKSQMNGKPYAGKAYIKTNVPVFQEVPLIIPAKTNIVSIDLTPYISELNTSKVSKVDIINIPPSNVITKEPVTSTLISPKILEVRIISESSTNVVKVPTGKISWIDSEFLIFYFGTLLLIFWVLTIFFKKKKKKKDSIESIINIPTAATVEPVIEKTVEKTVFPV